MAGKRSVRSKRPLRTIRRKRTSRKRVRVSHRTASTGIRPSAVTRYSALRSFIVYPKKATNDDKTPVGPLWLDKLYKYGLMALRLFTVLLASPGISDDGTIDTAEWKFAVTSVCQGFWIGVDDFIINSPISESITRFGKNHLARFDYKQGRVSSFSISVTPGSELAKRAGEYVIAVVMLSIEQSSIVVDPNYPPTGGVVYLPDIVSFEDAMQYPNAVVCPCDKPTQITVHTSGNAAEWHRIGHYIETADTADFPGGPPIVKVVIGYRDMSASSPNAAYLYTPEEATLQVEMTAKMAFREPGSAFIRTRPLKSMDDTKIQATLDNGRTLNIPIDQVSQVGALVSVPHAIMEAYLESEMMIC